MVNTVKMDIPAPPHAGALLTNYIKTHRIYQSALGRVLGLRPASIQSYKRRAALQSDTLWSLSHALKHNFFADIAALLPAVFTTDALPDSAPAARIAELEEQVKLLTVERDVWMKAAGR